MYNCNSFKLNYWKGLSLKCVKYNVKLHSLTQTQLLQDYSISHDVQNDDIKSSAGTMYRIEYRDIEAVSCRRQHRQRESRA